MEETDDAPTQYTVEVRFVDCPWGPGDKILFSFTPPASWRALPVPSISRGLPFPSSFGFSIHKQQRLMPKKRSPWRVLKERIHERVMPWFAVIVLTCLLICEKLKIIKKRDFRLPGL